MEPMERRFESEAKFHVENRAADKQAVIVGYPAKFNRLSQDLGWFREEIRPGAFSRTIAKPDDIRALFNHDANLVLGRMRPSTLRLREDDTGLRMEVDVPDTTFAKDLLETMKRGDVDQGSFGFRTISDEWRMQDGENIRTLVEVKLFDVSVVTFPAYEDTVTQVRSLFAVAGADPAPLLRALLRVEHKLELQEADVTEIAAWSAKLAGIMRVLPAGQQLAGMLNAKRRLELAELG